jgi:hypothetical protein
VDNGTNGQRRARDSALVSLRRRALGVYEPPHQARCEWLGFSLPLCALVTRGLSLGRFRRHDHVQAPRQLSWPVCGAAHTFDQELAGSVTRMRALIRKCGGLRLSCLVYLASQFLLPFALNQSGSIVYVYLLGSSGQPHHLLCCVDCEGGNRLTNASWNMTRDFECRAHLQLAHLRVHSPHEPSTGGETPPPALYAPHPHSARPLLSLFAAFVVTYAGMVLILIGVAVCFDSKRPSA